MVVAYRLGFGGLHRRAANQTHVKSSSGSGTFAPCRAARRGLDMSAKSTILNNKSSETQVIQANLDLDPFQMSVSSKDAEEV